MLAYLKTHSSARTILCEKTDRLYRNFKDYVALDVDQQDLTVILAKNYIDNLKEETGKGLREKAEQGEFPSKAPIGYRNKKETKRVDGNHGGSLGYAPNSFGEWQQQPDFAEPPLNLEGAAAHWDQSEDTDYYA